MMVENSKFKNQNSKVRMYGSEAFEPAQVMRFEKYVDSKYPEFHFRKRRQYAKGVLKYQNIKLIESHIYPGVKLWDSSPTLAARLAAALKKLAVRLNVSIKGLKHKGQFQKLKLINLMKEKRKNLVGQAPDIIGATDGLGGRRTITGTLAKAFHLINRLLNTLGLSLRLNPSGFPVAVKRLEEAKHLQLDCMVCGKPLGHWYRNEYEENEFVFGIYPSGQKKVLAGGVHFMCEYPTDKEGVLL